MTATKATEGAAPVPGMLNQGDVFSLSEGDLIAAVRASAARTGFCVGHVDRRRAVLAHPDGRRLVAVAHAARCQIDLGILRVLQEAEAYGHEHEYVVAMPDMAAFRGSAARIDPDDLARLKVGWLWVAGDGSVEHETPPDRGTSAGDDGKAAAVASHAAEGAPADQAQACAPPSASPNLSASLAATLRELASVLERFEPQARDSA